MAELKALAYSEEFGDRFGYMGEGLSDLPEELFAIEFSVERSSFIVPDLYSCVLKVYVKTGLGLDFPEGTDVGNIDTVGGAHFFAQNFLPWKTEDVSRFSERLNDYSQKAYIATTAPADLGIEESIDYVAHYVQLYEGVDFLKFRGCMVFTDAIHDADASLQLRLALIEAAGSIESVNDERALLNLDLPPDFARIMVRNMRLVQDTNSVNPTL
ncbi:MAG: hypothetical protein SV422_03155, partial [Pseudomonadota bacterium]|nr:hypothetical protein [Pseudomonadota bacterium]